MSTVEEKQSLVHKLNGTFSEKGYTVTVLNDDQFHRALQYLLNSSAIECRRVFHAVEKAGYVALWCDDKLYHEVKNVFHAETLSRHTRQLLRIIIESGWSLADPKWTGNIILLVKDSISVARLHYWTFLDRLHDLSPFLSANDDP
jgi:hypothetical protein